MPDLQLDGLPGPTHHFAGLGVGNRASLAHAHQVSHPQAAALQGLAKMRVVLDLGVPQAVLPPLARPDLAFLRACGFVGDDGDVLAAAWSSDRELLRLAMSSAFMWAANAATVAPGCDTVDGRTRMLPANLVATPHRALEAPRRAAQLRALFAGTGIAVLDPLPATAALADEGAANHSRLGDGDAPGVHLFVHGRDAALAADAQPRRFPARHTAAAARAAARRLRLPEHRVLHARQHPDAIDAGAFHNDVVMVADGRRVLIHEHALVDQVAVLERAAALVGNLRVATVAAADLPLDAAVSSYLFNSQLLETPSGVVLLAPAQAGSGAAGAVIRRLLADGFIAQARFVDLGESMANGGGPACLRLRLPLTAAERAGLPAGMIVDHPRLDALEAWVRRHYRVELRADDLGDPALLAEGHAARVDLGILLALPVDAREVPA